jgi:hypothetical protein
VGVKQLVQNVEDFRDDNARYSPQVLGIEPKEALNRLKL